MHVRRLTPLISTLVLLLWCTAASAQTPEPGGCTLEPVSLPLFDATPAAEIAAPPVATPASIGSPVDERTITVAVETIFTCINTGDAAYAYAVFTDAYLARLVVETDAYQPALELDIESHAPTAFDTFTVDAVEAIEPQADGRVSVTVTYGNGSSSFTDVLVLARVGDAWLIDEVTALDPDA